MSTEKSKKRKGGSYNDKITSKNKHAEDQKSDVLVLPPDLLLKLGINLENIQSPQLSSIENNAGACSNSNEFLRIEASELNTENEYIPNNEKETSILETASLMKASVFLSPTFSSLKSNISLDSESNNSEICIKEIIVKTSDTIKTDKQNKHFNNKDDKDDTQINDCKKSISGDEIQSNIVKSTCKDIHNIIESVKASAKGLEEKNEHPKAIQMESNNRTEEEILEVENIKVSKKNKSAHKNAFTSTASPTLDATISMSNKSTNRNKPLSSNTILDATKKKQCKQKINPEKYDSSAKCSFEEFCNKLNERNAPKVSNVNDKDIKIGKELDNNSNNCSSHDENVTLGASLEDELKLEEPIVKKKCGENISVQHHPNIRSIAKKISGDLYLPTTSEYQTDIQNKPSNALCNEENNSYDSHEEIREAKRISHENNNLDNGQKDIASDSNCAENASCMSQQLIDNIDNRSSESNSSLGKVEEIAFYLSQHKLNSMTKNIKTTQTTSNSKLCIQGVEKPGGDIKSIHLNRNIKTYSRRQYPKLFNTTRNPLISYSDYNVDSDIDYKINDINLYSGTKELHTFCICDDFGKFLNYDLDSSYGHIHFWDRKEVQCSVETLLSMYEESNLTDEKKGNILSSFDIEDIDEESQQGISCDSDINICWNYDRNINKKENHEYNSQKLPNMNDVEVLNKDENIDNVETPLNKGKRKRVDKTSESESESEKFSAKKATTTIKCGVCSTEVSKYKWNNHISKEHCLIAWRAGQEINGDKAGDTTETPEIVIEVPLDYDILEKGKIEKLALDTKCEKKQITEPRKRQKTEIKKTVEDPLQLGNVEKQLIGKDLWQTETRQDHVVEVFQVVTEEQSNIEMPISQLLETGQTQETNLPVLQLLETGINQEAEVPVIQLVETGENQEAELHVLQVETGQKQIHGGQKQVPEVLTLQGKTEQKQAIVPVLEIKNRQKQVAQVPVVKTREKNVTCGVCKTVIRDSLWMEHITQKHNYIAWKDGERPLDCEDEEDIRHYLNNIIKEVGELVCKICGLKRKFAKSYLKHIKNCPVTEQSNVQVMDQAATSLSIKFENNDSENTRGRRVRKERNYKDDTENTEEVNVENIKKEKIYKIDKDKTRKSDTEIVKEVENVTVTCGVCRLQLSNAQWMEHIFKEHDYLAWQEGESEINMNDKQQVYDHLFYITKQIDGLTCKKCGLTRRYVKSYLKHIDICEGETDTANVTLGSDGTMEASTIDTLILDLSNDEKTKCGVCHMDVEEKQWFSHVHKCHAYLAWKEGKPALDLENEQEVQEYLYFVSKKYNGLICHKCGLNRKYVKAYLSHLESCESKILDPSILGDGITNKDSFVCAICSEVVDPKEWNNHAMKMHYNIAWAVGDYPVDVKSVSAVEKLLKVYQKQTGSFKCKICGTKRASPMGFYVHIIQCGKTEEEIDQFKVFCELCNSKYLCFYKSQHGIMHREQELSKRRMNCEREQTQDNTQEVNESIDSPQVGQHSGRRRAAEKARQFIEKSETFAHNCSKCGYGADDGAELDEHACTKVNYKDYSDSEDSALVESGDESLDSAVDSNLSDEEATSERKRKKGHGDLSAATKVPRMPFAVKCAKSYLKQSMEDYRNAFLTNGTLYPQWRTCNIELIADDQIATYWPPLKESCNVIIGRSDPVTYNLFQAKKQNGFSIFVGGCIQAISWAPPHLDDSSDALGHFLAVVCHNDVDAPRLDCAKAYEYSGLIQIWDFGDLSSTYPEFALGIAHDYGTVWAIDWCPSGVRDIFPLEEDNELESIPYTFLRLGLLAVACSNGSAYIFSVPYPSIVKFNDKNVCKLTPVAELRLSRGKRDSCQATSINWSPQNGHGTVMVGYSSGTVALYNLECDSPLLMENEGVVNIFYPFLDERPHSSCITDVKAFPSSVGAGLMSSVSPTGSETAQQRGFARIHKHLSSTSSAFAPHWPALMVSGNELIVNQAVNELDFWHQGRRTGAVQRCCGCLYCGHMATFSPPVVKILTTHPAYTDFNKEPIALIQMRPLSRKRTKQMNDELQVKLEPLTYYDAVKLYALDFKLMKDLDKESARQVNKPREQYPERFPLNDVPSMAFYPSQKHHKKLAVATHAGIIFILTDDITL